MNILGETTNIKDSILCKLSARLKDKDGMHLLNEPIIFVPTLQEPPFDKEYTITMIGKRDGEMVADTFEGKTFKLDDLGANVLLTLALILTK